MQLHSIVRSVESLEGFERSRSTRVEHSSNRIRQIGKIFPTRKHKIAPSVSWSCRLHVKVRCRAQVVTRWRKS
eukprot:4068499-Amphidinium_carterae.2